MAVHRRGSSEAVLSALARLGLDDVLEELGGIPAPLGRERDEIVELGRRRLVDSMSGVTGTARHLVDQRLQEVGEQLARCEGQLAAAERELANLDALEVEVGWVAGCLADFDAVWDVLTPENRGRLLRAIVQRVEVDEPKNQVTVVLADLGADITANAQPRQEVSP